MKLRLVDEDGHEYKAGDRVPLEDYDVVIESILPPKALGGTGFVQLKAHYSLTPVVRLGLRFEKVTNPSA